MHRRRFVTSVYELDVAPDGGVEDREDLIAGEREEVRDLRFDQSLDENIGASQRHDGAQHPFMCNTNRQLGRVSPRRAVLKKAFD